MILAHLLENNGSPVRIQLCTPTHQTHATYSSPHGHISAPHILLWTPTLQCTPHTAVHTDTSGALRIQHEHGHFSARHIQLSTPIHQLHATYSCPHRHISAYYIQLSTPTHQMHAAYSYEHQHISAHHIHPVNTDTSLHTVHQLSDVYIIESVLSFPALSGKWDSALIHSVRAAIVLAERLLKL